eukprot:97087_1
MLMRQRNSVKMSSNNSHHTNADHYHCHDENHKRGKSNNIRILQIICVGFIFVIMFMMLYDKYMVTNDKTPSLPDDRRFTGSEIQSTTEDDAFKKKYFDEKNAKQRIITNIILDKPIYRPDETIYLSAFLFNGVSMAPYIHDTIYIENIQVQIIDSKDIVIQDQRKRVDVKNSIFALQYQIPSNLKGGEYKIKIKYDNHYKPTGLRKFQILNSNNKMNPKLRKQVEFLKKVFSVGEECQVKILCTDCNKNVLITSVIAKVDDVVIYKLDETPLQLSYDVDKHNDNIQSVVIKFTMPDSINIGNGNIAVTYQDESIIETLSKTIPIALSYLDINHYPESNNYLIPGLNNQRVYFEGFNPKTKEPADYEGEIITLPDKKIVSKIISHHEGRAVSEYFTVEKNKQYIFKITLPISCKGQTIQLKTTSNKDMKLISNRAVLTSTQYAYGFNDIIDFKVQANTKDIYKIKLFKRELLITCIDLNIDNINKIYQKNFIHTDLRYNHIGVLRMTVFTSDN